MDINSNLIVSYTYNVLLAQSPSGIPPTFFSFDKNYLLKFVL